MYIAYLSHSIVAKNKLEDAFYNYLKAIDRTLIGDAFIADFQQRILDKYNELCKEHSRCKPVPKSFGSGYKKNGDRILYHANATFTILKSK